jgi:peptide methionine sulfoxide reductase msrA/msrB
MRKRLWTIIGVATALLVPLLVAAGQRVTTAESEPSPSSYETAYFAGGCFWCVESDFEKQPGVIEVISGYTGGVGDNPTYATYAEQGHFEAVAITYDPDRITYQDLLDVFWRLIDPTDGGGQFVDRGSEYRAAVIYLDREQKRLAEASKAALAGSKRFGKPIVTEVLPFSGFYRAEAYHQDYGKKHPLQYRYYRFRSGRDQFRSRFWKDDQKQMETATGASPAKGAGGPEAVEQGTLAPLQYRVTCPRCDGVSL